MHSTNQWIRDQFWLGYQKQPEVDPRQLLLRLISQEPCRLHLILSY